MQNDSINDAHNATTGRPSICVRQTVDENVMDILRNSEQMTWDSIDYLSSLIKAQSLKIDSLVSASSQSSAHRITSPVVDAIRLSRTTDNDSFVLNDSVHHENTNTTGPSLGTQMMESQVIQVMTDVETENNGASTNSAGVTESSLRDNRDEHAGMAENTDNVGAGKSSPSDIDRPPGGTESSPQVENCRECRCGNELHLSNLNPNTTTAQILEHIKNVRDIYVSPGELRVFKLTKKNQDVSKLKFVNFKIECCDRLARCLTSSGFWPSQCTIKPFIRKNVGNLSSAPSDFLFPNREGGKSI